MKIDFAKKEYNSAASAFLDMMGAEQKGITSISVDKLEPYPKQKTFRLYRPEKLQELSESIKAQGILSPVIVRPISEGKYQIIAGHNRTAAAKMAGITEIPCIIKDVDDKTADQIFVYTNLEQRDKLLPSEKAAAYKLLMESEDECQFGTAEKIAQHKGESRRQIFRYLKLNNLIKPFLDLVDNGTIPFNAGVNIAAFDQKSQYLLNDYTQSHKIKLSLKNVEELRRQAENDTLTYEIIEDVFKRPEKSKGKVLKLPLKEIGIYFGDLDESQIVEKVISIIKEHFERPMQEGEV